MVKEFRIILAPSPQNGSYVANSDVTGHVVLVTEKAKSGYKSIEVTLKGYATASWKRLRGSGDNVYVEWYYTRVNYTFARTAVVWSKDSAPDKQLAAGSYQFPFSLKFQASGPLPPSFHSDVGQIVYEVEAVIMKSSFKSNKKFSVELPISEVDANLIPGILEPKILQVQKTLCCLCCASGPITLTAHIPRRGFCIGIDGIPFEVDIGNGSNREIRKLQASLVKLIKYTADGHHQFDRRILQVVNSDTSIQPGMSSSWKPLLLCPFLLQSHQSPPVALSNSVTC